MECVLGHSCCGSPGYVHRRLVARENEATVGARNGLRAKEVGNGASAFSAR